MVPASRLGILRFLGDMRFLGEMPGAIGRAGQREQAAAFEDAVEESFGEMVVMEDLAPVLQALVGREDDGPAIEVAAVDDAVEDVGGVIDVGQVADLVDDEDIRLPVDGGRLGQAAAARRDRRSARPQ
jgi:hypothetical protein